MKSIIIKIFGVVVCVGLLLVLDYLGVSAYIDAKEHVISVPCASRDIMPREQINEGDITFERYCWYVYGYTGDDSTRKFIL